MENSSKENISDYEIVITQDNSKEYPAGEAAVLKMLKHPEALVTDLSQVFDFAYFYNEQDEMMDDPVILNALAKEFGRTVDSEEFIWKLAKEYEERFL